jgi:hypothetical protein
MGTRALSLGLSGWSRKLTTHLQPIPSSRLHDSLPSQTIHALVALSLDTGASLHTSKPCYTGSSTVYKMAIWGRQDGCTGLLSAHIPFTVLTLFSHYLFPVNTNQVVQLLEVQAIQPYNNNKPKCHTSQYRKWNEMWFIIPFQIITTT